MAPYRQIGDMNMPGSYLIELAAMKVFGAGPLGWRLYDFGLLTIATGAFFLLTRRAGLFPAVFAGGLFALVHGRDGLAQAGQRDLTMGVLLVAATATLFTGVLRRSWWRMFAFGLLAGLAFTIKPTALPLSLAQYCLAVWVLRRPDPRSRKRDVGHPRPFWFASIGLLAAPLVALAFLLRARALAAFWANLHGLVPYYASLGHKPLGFLLLHSISPLLPLVLIWFAVLAFARPHIDLERGLLLCGVIFGLLSYVVQARGFPYYRYPLLAFLLPLMALDFTDAMGSFHRQKAAGTLAIAGLCVGGFFLGPQSAILIHRYRWWESGFSTSLEQNLDRLGGQRLSGRIQCIDSISGCDTTLYRMQLLPATGILLDFPLFGSPQRPVVQQARTEFRDKVFAHPPQVIVVSSALYVDGPGDYQKMPRWPELQAFLARDYRLDTDWKPTHTERWWSREELGPSYRIYVLQANDSTDKWK